MATKTSGSRLADVVFKTFTTGLFATTVVTGGWFAATAASASQHYDQLAREADKRKAGEAEAAAREEERRAKRWGWLGGGRKQSVLAESK